MTDCRPVLVYCCEGDPVALAHVHRPTPTCPCGWIGKEHHSERMARTEWFFAKHKQEKDM